MLAATKTTTTTPHDPQSNHENEDVALEEWRKKKEARKRLRETTSIDGGIENKFRNYEDMDDNDRNHHRHPSHTSTNKDDETNPELWTAAERRRYEQQIILKEATTALKTGMGEEPNNRRQILAKRRKKALDAKDGTRSRIVNSDDEGEDERDHRKAKSTDWDREGSPAFNQEMDGTESHAAVESLLEKAALLQQTLTTEQRAEIARNEEEARILREASKVQTNALQAAKEIAQGLVYTDPMPTSWRPPRYVLEQGEVAWNQIRKEWHMQVQGNDIPPPLKRFVDMKFPKPIIDTLHEKGIQRPTPIQIQGLPVALAGRDMVGIAFTGSGKTLAFSLPMVMAALEEELRMPIMTGEGPVGIILAPSRELARQTFDLVHEFCRRVSDTPGFPQLRCQLLIGGESVRDQLQLVQQHGVHCVVATPGRLRDVLKRKSINLLICRYICLDEADRMLDMGFDEEVGEIMNYFPHQRQTLLFSATFPKKFQDFARQTLVQPIVVNVGRAGAANLDVIQEVEYVKDEAKIVYLLHCLQKTAPPVIIFCEQKGAADDIHEYLLLKGVEAVSIHGGKTKKNEMKQSSYSKRERRMSLLPQTWRRRV